VVEDETAVRQLLASMLEELHYRVVIAENGDEALHLIEEKGLRPDLIITDMVMPGMGGKSLVEQVRKILPEQKVLYMSGYMDNAIAHHGMLDPLDPDTPFIQKPFTIHNVAVNIKHTLLTDEVAAAEGY
jgi:CheY-like chemotaxis protein